MSCIFRVPYIENLFFFEVCFVAFTTMCTSVSLDLKALYKSVIIIIIFFALGSKNPRG